MENRQLNADRFMGFAGIYDSARPNCPLKAKEIILSYLNRRPSVVVDMGCGTGLSTMIWSDADKIVGIEPSSDMRKVAAEKSFRYGNIGFIPAFADDTGLDDGCADVVTCSQSFHWMNPDTTLREVSRLLKNGGVFAAYDYDWPPVCLWEAELEYQMLIDKVTEVELTNPKVKDSYIRWDKNSHLSNMKESGIFRYAREIVFSNTEVCTADRFISMAFSQGSLQSIMKAGITEIQPYLHVFQDRIRNILGPGEFPIDFGYRMRIGVK